jgi:hypothetical protein
VASFQVGSDAIDKLVELGWLDPAKRGDSKWIADALIGLTERALALRVAPRCHNLVR